MAVTSFKDRPEGFNKYVGDFGEEIRVDPTIAHNLLCLLEAAKGTNGDLWIGVDGEEGCQPAGSKVILSNGEWKNIEEVRVGDKVLSPQINGETTFETVTNTVNWYSEENYKVNNLNRKQTVLYRCSGNHLIPVNTRTIPRLNGTRPFAGNYWGVKNFEARYYSKLGKGTKTNRTTLLMPLIKNFEGAFDSTINPYCLGVFLGDGSSSKKASAFSITGHTDDYSIIEKFSLYTEIMSKHIKPNTKVCTYRISNRSAFAKEYTRLGLKGKGSGEKFIPKECLLSSSEYRKELLAGIIDTDGTLGKQKSYSITTKSYQLAKDIELLVHSLGGRTNLYKINKTIKSTGFRGTYYTVSLYLSTDIPVVLKRKQKENSRFYLSSNRTSIDLEKDSGYRVYGFSITGESKFYITDNYAVTHNSGKTTFTCQLARLIDSNFNEGKIEFSPEELKERHFKGLPQVWDPVEYMSGGYPNKPWEVLDLDESAGLDRKKTMGAGSIEFTGFVTQSRQLHKIVFCTLPNFHLLNGYIAEHRVQALIHCYKHKKSKMGFYKYYTRKQIKEMFQAKNHTQKLYPRDCAFMGRFSSKKPFDMTAYDRKKAAALNAYRMKEAGTEAPTKREDVIYEYENLLMKSVIEQGLPEPPFYKAMRIKKQTWAKRKKTVIALYGLTVEKKTQLEKRLEAMEIGEAEEPEGVEEGLYVTPSQPYTVQ